MTFSLSRRDVLRTSFAGFGGVALADSLAQNGALAQDATLVGKSAVERHHPAKAERVILLFLAGGPSHMDLWEEKPELTARHDQAPPADAPSNGMSFGLENSRLLKPVAPFQRYGESGAALSTLLPNLGRVVDDLCFLRGCTTDNSAHEPAALQLHTGFINHGKPSMGAWLSYGLGSENANLPSFVSISVGSVYTGSGFLPAAHQATPFWTPAANGKSAIVAHLNDPHGTPTSSQARAELIRDLGRAAAAESGDLQMEGAIRSMELAFRMQAAAGELGDLSQETQETLELYGVGAGTVDPAARALLLARRCVESGVRFVACGIGVDWDHHGDIVNRMPISARSIDQAVAGLIEDLKRRGLLETTLVLCGGEFGRTPIFQADPRRVGFPGREHNRFGFTMWMAGGGVKPGFSYGATDPFGFAAIEGRVHMHDLHATVLHLMGLDHRRLTHTHAGREFRLTDVHGDVVKPVLA